MKSNAFTQLHKHAGLCPPVQELVVSRKLTTSGTTYPTTCRTQRVFFRALFIGLAVTARAAIFVSNRRNGLPRA